MGAHWGAPGGGTGNRAPLYPACGGWGETREEGSNQCRGAQLPLSLHLSKRPPPCSRLPRLLRRRVERRRWRQPLLLWQLRGIALLARDLQLRGAMRRCAQRLRGHGACVDADGVDGVATRVGQGRMRQLRALRAAAQDAVAAKARDDRNKEARGDGDARDGRAARWRGGGRDRCEGRVASRWRECSRGTPFMCGGESHAARRSDTGSTKEQAGGLRVLRCAAAVAAG